MSQASAKAYRAIRTKILNGDFEPGSHLKEEELALVCGVSRTPIRDALRQLAADLYVTIIPNHGTYVNDWTVGDIEDIFSLRAMLEGYAARRAAAHASEEQIARMRACCKRIDEVLTAADPLDLEGFLAANRELHSVLTEAAGSDRLSLMLRRLVEQPVVLRTAISYSRADLKRSNSHHWELVDALDSRDERWAESVMTSHILSAYETYKRTYVRTERGDRPLEASREA